MQLEHVEVIEDVAKAMKRSSSDILLDGNVIVGIDGARTTIFKIELPEGKTTAEEMAQIQPDEFYKDVKTFSSDGSLDIEFTNETYVVTDGDRSVERRLAEPRSFDDVPDPDEVDGPEFSRVEVSEFFDTVSTGESIVDGNMVTLEMSADEIAVEIDSDTSTFTDTIELERVAGDAEAHFTPSLLSPIGRAFDGEVRVEMGDDFPIVFEQERGPYRIRAVLSPRVQET